MNSATRFTTRTTRTVVTAASVLALTLAGCSGSGPTAGASEGTYPVVFGVFNPFSGGEAAFGPEKMAGCLTAVNLINHAGGLLTHKQVNCQSFDDRDDPVDAVPAAEQMVATTSHLVGVVGPTSDSGTATAPIINRAQITMFSDSGERTFDHTTLKYFWRIVPPDEDAGLAMALWAKTKGYTRAAAVFGNDISEQGNVPALIKGYTYLGGTITINQAVALDASSYRSEVAQMLATNPQAIFTEMDPQSAATYFSELAQSHPLIPIVGTAGTEGPDWWKAVGQAIGPQNMKTYYVGVQPYVNPSGAAWSKYNDSLTQVGSQIQNPAQYVADPYAMAVYDAVTVMGLAMTAAHSTNPTVYNAYVPKVVAAGNGAVVVHDFADGKIALDQGKSIDYVGTTGPITFNQWHNSPGAFEVNSVDPSNLNNLPLITTISAAQVAALAKAAGI